MGYIYKITTPNNRIYVGMTKDLKRRIADYRWKGKKQISSIINMSIQKYGWESHILEVLEELDNSLLNEREIFWIKEYNSFNADNPLGCNLTRGGEGGQVSWMNNLDRRRLASEYFKGERNPFYGKTHSEETKKNIGRKASIRNKDKGWKICDWGQERSRLATIKPVLAYCALSGNFLMEFDSLISAAKYYKFKRGIVSDSVRNNNICQMKYLFRYKTESYPLTIDVSFINWDMIKAAKPVVVTFPDGSIKEYISATEAAKEIPIPQNQIKRSADGFYKKTNSRKGYIFTYKDLYNQVTN